MEKVNNLIEFLVQHSEDKRISIHKLIKYGHRYYYINFYVDSEINTKQSNFGFRDSLEITFDNRNQYRDSWRRGRPVPDYRRPSAFKQVV